MPADPEATPREGTPAIDGRRSTACPSCGSSDTQSLPAAYAAGTSTINSKSSGGAVAFGPGNRMTPVLTSSSSSGIQQTELAKMCSPPVKQGRATAMGCLGALCVAGVLIGLMVAAMSDKDNAAGQFGGAGIALLMIMAFIPIIKKRAQFKKVDDAQWNRENEMWKKQWICLRCHHRYVPNR